MTRSGSCSFTLGAMLCASLVSACGGSTPSNTGDAGKDSGHAVSDGGREGGGRDTGAHEAGKRDSGTRDTGTDAPPDKTPIVGLAASKWTWVPFPDALCRDGSSTGIGVNLGTSTNLMIFLEGGGACFNPLTCLGGNPSSFSESDFETRAASTSDGSSINTGILDRTNAANPVKDWSFVYVPYCTGDIHGGNNVASVVGVGMPPTPQHFVGYKNVGLYLDRVIPTFPTTAHVLLTGVSAGGFGAALEYARVARAFGSTPVTLVDDSGPFMEDPYLATCIQDNVRTLWGLDGTVLADCGADCPTPASFFIDYARHIIKTYPTVNFGLADSTDDGTITQFFGFGANNCMGYAQVSGTTFTAGLLDIRAQLASQSNFGEFIFTGTDHTTLESSMDSRGPGSSFYTRTAGGGDGGTPVLMTDWVVGLLSGTASNAGP